MNTELNSVILDYFEEYRRKKQQRDRLTQSLTSASETVKNLRKDMEDISNEISCMQRIITAMIEHDCDPVEAKMRINDLQAGNIWYDNQVITLADDSSYQSINPIVTMTDIIGTIR